MCIRSDISVWQHYKNCGEIPVCYKDTPSRITISGNKGTVIPNKYQKYMQPFELMYICTNGYCMNIITLIALFPLSVILSHPLSPLPSSCPLALTFSLLSPSSFSISSLSLWGVKGCSDVRKTFLVSIFVFVVEIWTTQRKVQD